MSSKRGPSYLESEEKFRNLAESSPNMIFINKAGRVVFANRLCCEIMKYSLEEFYDPAFNFLALVAPEYQPLVRANFQSHMAGEEVPPYEYALITKDGQRLDMIINTRLIDFEGGRAILGVVTDITGLKQAEAALRESEERYRTLFEKTASPILVIDTGGNYIDCNESALRFVECTRQELLLKNIRDFVPPDQGRQVLADHKPLWRSGGTIETQYYIHGKIKLLELTITPAVWHGKQVVFGIGSDITERKLAEERLRQSERLEAIGTLAGGIAHDFNNLLQGIFGYISMAKRTLSPQGPSFAMLEQAEQALHMSVNLTTQLLTFAKGGKPVKRPMHLPPLLESAAKFALSGSRSQYRISLADDLRTVAIDEGQISQVIQNIVLNADQAMPAGGTITICASNAPPPEQTHCKQLGPGRYVEVAIMDTGAGIPEEHLRKIFDPYFSTKEKGSGLGLATVYSIIKNHGGEINVETEMGRGTTFFIYLPAAEATLEVQEKPGVFPMAARAKVLVMDDEELVLNIAGEMLKVLGHEADFARHGQEAVEKYRGAQGSGRPYDIVILDLTVRGGMGGREALAQLLAIDPGVKAIVSSGYSEDVVMAEFEGHGFKARLSKPYKVGELRDAISALLRMDAR